MHSRDFFRVGHETIMHLSIGNHNDDDMIIEYDRNHYFGFGPIPKLKPRLADTSRNHISKGET